MSNLSDKWLGSSKEPDRVGLVITDKITTMPTEMFRSMSKESEAKDAEIARLEERFGYLEGDWERRNHIIASQADKIEKLQRVVDAAKPIDGMLPCPSTDLSIYKLRKALADLEEE